MIVIGSTARHEFTFPYDRDNVVALVITYKQGGNILLEKTLDDCFIEAGLLSTNLTQEESLLFKANSYVSIQIKVKLADGSVDKSDEIRVVTDNALNKEVI